MPSPSSVHEQLTDILVRVVSCPADAVVPPARLDALGTDSLTVMEVGEELGRRFDVYLSDQTINEMQTVQDAIDAVVTAAPATIPEPPEVVSMSQQKSTPPRQPRGRSTGFALRFVFLGLVVGGVLGLGGAALVSATGLGKVDLPPIAAPTTPPEPTPTETSAPEPTTPTTEAPVEPTITTSSERVSPGERFLLSGAFPDSEDGEDLQVEVREPGDDAWDEFPIQTKVRDGGIFRTELYTSRTGTREFRVKNTDSGKATPPIKVEIG